MQKCFEHIQYAGACKELTGYFLRPCAGMGNFYVLYTQRVSAIKMHSATVFGTNVDNLRQSRKYEYLVMRRIATAVYISLSLYSIHTQSVHVLEVLGWTMWCANGL